MRLQVFLLRICRWTMEKLHLVHSGPTCLLLGCTMLLGRDWCQVRPISLGTASGVVCCLTSPPSLVMACPQAVATENRCWSSSLSSQVMSIVAGSNHWTCTCSRCPRGPRRQWWARIFTGSTMSSVRTGGTGETRVPGWRTLRSYDTWKMGCILEPSGSFTS
jgi:hypothetical protein